MSEINPEIHPWPAFLPPDATLLMLGSFPPPEKRWSMPFFYPNIQNDFWRILGLIFYEDVAHFIMPPQDKPGLTSKSSKVRFNQCECERFLIQHKIALYDAAVCVIRQRKNASDSHLEVLETVDLHVLLSQIPNCTTIAVTGQKALKTVLDILKPENPELVAPRIGCFSSFTILGRVLKLYCMPSTSRAYPRSLKEKAEVYRLLFNYL